MYVHFCVYVFQLSLILTNPAPHKRHGSSGLGGLHNTLIPKPQKSMCEAQTVHLQTSAWVYMISSTTFCDFILLLISIFYLLFTVLAYCPLLLLTFHFSLVVVAIASDLMLHYIVTSWVPRPRRSSSTTHPTPRAQAVPS